MDGTEENPESGWLRRSPPPGQHSRWLLQTAALPPAHWGLPFLLSSIQLGVLSQAHVSSPVTPWMPLIPCRWGFVRGGQSPLRCHGLPLHVHMHLAVRHRPLCWAEAGSSQSALLK